jgi:hypothetical protein
MKYVYLAGAIQDEPDPTTWRQQAANLMPSDWKAIDPTKHECDYYTIQELVQLDIDLICKCHAMLAKVDKPSWGTAMEIRMAHLLTIPILAFEAPEKRSPWLIAHVDGFFVSLPNAIQALERLDDRISYP